MLVSVVAALFFAGSVACLLQRLAFAHQQGGRSFCSRFAISLLCRCSFCSRFVASAFFNCSTRACTSCPLLTKKLMSKATATRPIDNFRNPNFSFPFNLLLKLGSCLWLTIIIHLYFYLKKAIRYGKQLNIPFKQRYTVL